MNLTVAGIKPREDGDPDYADFWLEIIHMDSHVSWEVPLSKDEASKMKRYLPKFIQEDLTDIKDFWQQSTRK